MEPTAGEEHRLCLNLEKEKELATRSIWEPRLTRETETNSPQAIHEKAFGCLMQARAATYGAIQGEVDLVGTADLGCALPAPVPVLSSTSVDLGQHNPPQGWPGQACRADEPGARARLQ